MENFNYWISTKKRNYVHHDCSVDTIVKIADKEYDICLQNGHDYFANDYNKPSNFFSCYTEYLDKKIADFWNFGEWEIENFDSEDLEKYGFETIEKAMDFYHDVQNSIQNLIDESDSEIEEMMKKGNVLDKIEDLLLDNDFDSEILMDFYGEINDPDDVLKFLSEKDRFAESKAQSRAEAVD